MISILITALDAERTERVKWSLWTEDLGKKFNNIKMVYIKRNGKLVRNSAVPAYTTNSKIFKILSKEIKNYGDILLDGDKEV